jgi:hypothetical protein
LFRPSIVRERGFTTSFLALVFFIGFIVSLSNPFKIFYGVPPAIRMMLIIPVIS